MRRGAVCACAKLAGTSHSGRVRKIVRPLCKTTVLVKQLAVSARRGRVHVSLACGDKAGYHPDWGCAGQPQAMFLKDRHFRTQAPVAKGHEAERLAASTAESASLLPISAPFCAIRRRAGVLAAVTA